MTLTRLQVRGPYTAAQEKELAAACRAAERYIREHGEGGEPGHHLIYMGNSPEWQRIRERLTAAMWPPAEPPGEQLGLFGEVAG